MFEDKIEKLNKKVSGKLIIKEYPTDHQTHANHFRALLQELSIKKSFKPDIIFIDYLNICASSRFAIGSNINSYTLINQLQKNYED